MEDGKEGMIRFGLYNIRNGCNGGLESELHGVAQSNMQILILQETILAAGLYAQDLVGYHVVTSNETIFHHSSVVFFCGELLCFAV